MNIKRFEEFKNKSVNENIDQDLDIKGHVAKIMDALYGMDEKYEEEVAASYNEKTNEIKLVLDNEEEVSNISSYLNTEGYNLEEKEGNCIVIKL